MNITFDWTHAFYIGTLAITLLGDILIPILFFRFERMERGRREMHNENISRRQQEFNTIQKRLDHLDNCIDSVKEKVVSQVELTAIENRIYRLESAVLHKGAYNE